MNEVTPLAFHVYCSGRLLKSFIAVSVPAVGHFFMIDDHGYIVQDIVWCDEPFAVLLQVARDDSNPKWRRWGGVEDPLR